MTVENISWSISTKVWDWLKSNLLALDLQTDSLRIELWGLFFRGIAIYLLKAGI